jgi:Fe-S-cluster containining protein
MKKSDILQSEKFGCFTCKRCGECCHSNLGVLFDGFLNEEWIPIIEYMKKHYPNGITIENEMEDIKWTGKIKSVEDIIIAKEDHKSSLYWALDMCHCPFVKKDPKGLFYCEIYSIRPIVCKDYRCDLSSEQWKEYIGYKPPK